MNQIKSWEKFGKLITESARKRAFDAGFFISYGENGKVIREYPDGRKTEVIRDEYGNRKEVDYTP